MAYTEWGDPANPRVLLCVHGLTRNGRDFDDLARAMAPHYRVVCPDVVGRGQSGWLAVKDDYQLPTYVADMITLIARLNVETVHWVGTSMGGLIGLALAAQDGSPIRRLVLNDVGPELAVEALRRIGDYVGADPTWISEDEAVAYVRAISPGFGPLTDAQWRYLTETSIARRPDGRWGFRYDPRIGEAYRAAFADQERIDLWPLYERIACPTLVIRGAESDLLARATWQAMAERGPRAQLAEFPGVGHAPMFQSEDQIGVVRDFLLHS